MSHLPEFLKVITHFRLHLPTAHFLAAGFFGFGSLFGRGKQNNRNIDEFTLYRTVVENTTEGVAVIQGDRFVYVNLRMEQIFGRSVADLPGRDAFLDIHPDDLSMVRSRRQKRLGGIDTVQNYPFRIVSVSGEERWVNVTSRLIEWQGQTSLVELYTDITESKRAINVIKEDEERLGLAMRATDFAYFDNDIYNNTYFFSPRFFTMLGYEENGLPGQITSWEDLIHPQDREVYESVRENQKLTDIPGDFSMELRLRNSAGGWTWVLSQGRIVQRHPDGRPRRVVGTHTDITPLKYVQEALSISEEKFSTVFRLIPYSISINRLSDQVFIEINQGYTELFGYTREEVIGKNSLDLGTWYDPAERALWFREMDSEKITIGLDTVFIRKDGSQFNGRIIGRQITLNGELCQMVVVEDITARKSAEESLRNSELSYRLMFDGAAVGVFQTRKDGTILKMNPAFVKMLGYSSQEESINTLKNAVNAYADAAQRREILSQLEKGSVSATGELLFLRKDGSLVNVRMSIWEVTDGMGNEMYLEGFIEDISEQKASEAKIKLQLNRLASLHLIDQAISASHDMGETLDVLLRQVLDRLDVDAADVLLIDPVSGDLKFAVGTGFNTHTLPEAGQVIRSSCAERAVLNRETVNWRDDGSTPELLSSMPIMSAGGYIEYYGVPLCAKEKMLGLLEIYNSYEKPASDDWLDFLGILAGQAAIAVENATLVDGMIHANKELVEAYDATIAGWAHALELRDGDTGDHSQRVADMAVALAESLGVSGDDLLQIRRGSLLHDIGKMSIPDRILLKAGPLDDEEWKIMRMHPVYALEVVKPISFLTRASEIIYCHHERWDGNGYPRGLKGEEIPLSARIFAIVDVWDALNSDRPYRPAWRPDRILREIRELSGRHFDPRVVEAFLKLI